MRVVVFACVGFTLGLGAATAVLAVRGAADDVEAELAADSVGVAADTAAAAADSAAALHGPPAMPGEAPEAGTDSATAAKRGAPRPDRATGTVRAATAGQPPAGGAGADANAAAARVSKIFAAMEPQDAARVLELLQNNQVQVILAHMSERKVASILVHLDPARAAELSRQAMRLPETH